MVYPRIQYREGERTRKMERERKREKRAIKMAYELRVNVLERKGGLIAGSIHGFLS
jgi:hypothetical protein